MKSLSNLSKIGDAALSHLFKPYQSENYTRQLFVCKDEVDLNLIHLDPQACNYLFLWGVRNGLVKIKVEKPESALNAIARKFNDVKILKNFSHIVEIREWSSKALLVNSDHETVRVYRLTPNLREVISCTYDWIEYEEKIS